MNFRKRGQADLPGFQLAPMIDIVFNLLCFFIVGQVFAQWEKEIDVKLPTAQSAAMLQRLEGEIIINVRKDGTMVINRQELDEAGLKAMLGRVAGMFNRQPVLIRADKETPYQYIVRVLDVCRQVDIWNISFATSVDSK